MMITKYADINNHKIAYLDNEINSDEVILCVHGNSSSKESFKNFAESYKSKRVIAFDLYGHGESDKAKNYDLYKINSYINLIDQLTNRLNLKNIILLGHSLGGHIAIQAYPSLKHKILRIVVWGTPPLTSAADFSSAFSENENLGALFSDQVSDEQAIEFVKLCFKDHSHENLNFWKSVFMKTDPAARATLGASLATGEIANEVEILREVNNLLIIHGNDDKIINKNYLNEMKKNEDFNIVFCNFSHCPQAEDLESFLEEIINFLNTKSSEYL